MAETKESKKAMSLKEKMGRYDFVKLAKGWFYLTQKNDDNKYLNQSEMVKKVIEEISSGKLTEDDIAKANVAVKSVPAYSDTSKQ